MFSRLTTWLPGNTLCRENAPVKAHVRYKDVFSIAGIIGMVTLLGLLFCASRFTTFSLRIPSIRSLLTIPIIR